MIFLAILVITEILCSFRLVQEGKTGKEIPESSRLEFLEKFSANNLALSDVEDNTSRPLNKGGIADLALLRTPFEIRQKSRELNLWEVMDSFVLSERLDLIDTNDVNKQYILSMYYNPATYLFYFLKYKIKRLLLMFTYSM